MNLTEILWKYADPNRDSFAWTPVTQSDRQIIASHLLLMTAPKNTPAILSRNRCSILYRDMHLYTYDGTYSGQIYPLQAYDFLVEVLDPPKGDSK